MTRRSKFFTLAILLTVIIWLFSRFHGTLEQYKTTSIHEQRYAFNSHRNPLLASALDKAAYNKKVILIWHASNETIKQDIYMGWKCGSCIMSYNKTKIDDDKVAAIVFLYKFVKPKLMPSLSTRRVDQLYVWQTGESMTALVNLRHKDFFYEDSIQFNATMSYRRDSDFYMPYMGMGQTNERNTTKILMSKTRLAVAVVSNCGRLPGAQARIQYLRELEKHLKLDTFGACFNASIDNISTLHKTIEEYKFYFAMENSYHCRDYITEKFIRNGFVSNSVPVVWGATKEDYEAIAPSHSYIFIEDFDTMENLVNYLNYLDANDTAYLEYFRWKENKSHQSMSEKLRKVGVCQLCRATNGINIDDVFSITNNVSTARPMFDSAMSRRTVQSLRDWILDENEECFAEKLAVDQRGKIVKVSKETT